MKFIHESRKSQRKQKKNKNKIESLSKNTNENRKPSELLNSHQPESHLNGNGRLSCIEKITSSKPVICMSDEINERQPNNEYGQQVNSKPKLSLKNYEIRSHRSNVNTNNSRDQNKATILLIATVLVFLICQTPSALLLIYDAIFPLENETNKVVIDVILGLNNIANGLTAINASINFILYCCLSDKFRKTFKRFFLSTNKDKNSNALNSNYLRPSKTSFDNTMKDTSIDHFKNAKNIKVYKFKSINNNINTS
jgi:hypothetical protein